MCLLTGQYFHSALSSLPTTVVIQISSPNHSASLGVLSPDDDGESSQIESSQIGFPQIGFPQIGFSQIESCTQSLSEENLRKVAISSRVLSDRTRQTELVRQNRPWIDPSRGDSLRHVD